MKNISVSRVNEVNTMIDIILQRAEYKENSENGLVILLNGEWGSGKTVFLHELENKISENNQISLLANYNAFENDFYENPYIPFFATIDNKINLKDNFTKLINATSKVAKTDILAFSYMITRSFIKNTLHVDIDDVRKKEKEILDEYNKEKNYLKDFKDFCELKNRIKTKIKKVCKDKPHVLIIDELDRCNPTFAVNTLEIVKHFFDIKNCIVIIAVDKKQLQESAKTIFGQNMNSEKYFSKFFDYQFNLYTINFYEIVDTQNVKEIDEIIRSATLMFEMLNISLRDSKKIFKEFVKKNNNWNYQQSRCMLLLFVLKYTDLSFYNAVMRGEYESYKRNIESEYNPDSHKYIYMLSHTIGKDMSFGDFLTRFTQCRNEMYIDAKFISAELLNTDLDGKRKQNILKLMMVYIPQVEINITYRDTIKKIIG